MLAKSYPPAAYYQSVFVCAFLAIAVLAVARLPSGRWRWFTIVLMAILMTPIGIAFIAALFENTHYGRNLLLWPFPYPHLEPNLVVWMSVWLIFGHFWVQRIGDNRPVRLRGDREAELEATLTALRDELTELEAMLAGLRAIASRDASPRNVKR